MIKTFVVGVVLLLITCLSVTPATYVKGYYRKNGTYVSPHYRSAPTNTVKDNYSYKGNTNPYTAQQGTNYYRNNPTSDHYQGYNQGYKRSNSMRINSTGFGVKKKVSQKLFNTSAKSGNGWGNL